MQQETVTFSSSSGWSAALPTELDSEQTLVLAFSAAGFCSDPVPLEQLAAAFPQSVLLGCSGAGEIAGTQVNDESISVAIVRFAHTRLRRAMTCVPDAADSFAAGVRLAAELDDPDLRAVFVLSDGVSVNGTALADGLTRHLPAGVVITGGLAGDISASHHTWVVDGGRPVSGWITAVGLCGERLRVGHGCDGGWSGFGPERRITRSEGNVLFELDGKPALDLYKAYLGDRAVDLPTSALLFPLSVQRGDSSSAPLVRSILAVDEAQQSMIFAGDLPQGGVARLMRGNTDKLISSAGRAGQQAVADLNHDGAALVICVSCFGRRLALGERVEEELEAVADHAPAGVVYIGFYAYGEIAPLACGRPSELHNQTMTVTAFSED